MLNPKDAHSEKIVLTETEQWALRRLTSDFIYSNEWAKAVVMALGWDSLSLIIEAYFFADRRCSDFKCKDFEKCHLRFMTYLMRRLQQFREEILAVNIVWKFTWLLFKGGKVSRIYREMCNDVMNYNYCNHFYELPDGSVLDRRGSNVIAIS